MKKVTCPYCQSAAVLKDAFVIYRKLGFGEVYHCEKCVDVYVGVHKGTTKPKGTLANKALRELRMRVHAVFDPIWRDGNAVERCEAYAAAAQVMKVREFHIGDMGIDQAGYFLRNSDELIDAIKVTVQRNRLVQLGSPECSNLLNVLRYLYVSSQKRTCRVLPHSAYRGHVASFKAAMNVGLVRHVRKAETKKTFYALTPAGCSAIGIENQ
jgi:hypothetical protein